MLLQIVQKNSYKIIIIFGLVIKRIFVKNCCSSNSLVDNFKSADFILLSYCVLSRDTVIKRDLIRLSKNINKKGSDLSANNFHYSFSNRHMKNTQKCTHMLEKTDLDSIF